MDGAVLPGSGKFRPYVDGQAFLAVTAGGQLQGGRELRLPYAALMQPVAKILGPCTGPSRPVTAATTSSSAPPSPLVSMRSTGNRVCRPVLGENSHVEFERGWQAGLTLRGLFTEAKDWHGLRGLRRCGLLRANVQGLLIAAGQNLKRYLAASGWGRRHAPCGSLLALPQEPVRLSAAYGGGSIGPETGAPVYGA